MSVERIETFGTIITVLYTLTKLFKFQFLNFKITSGLVSA